VVHTSNSSYSEDKDLEDHGLRSDQTEKYKRPLFSTNNPGMMKHACGPSYKELQEWGSWFEANPGKNHRTLSEKQLKQKRTGGIAQVTDSLLRPWVQTTLLPKKKKNEPWHISSQRLPASDLSIKELTQGNENFWQWTWLTDSPRAWPNSP
jgi:hypothetical protein